MSGEKGKVNYKNTLNLPKTSFSMKANLPQREPEMQKKWEEKGLYEKVLASRKDKGGAFVLHDGPPYANGHIHMGHVLNKILKDICVKYNTLKGKYSPYVPGWDCHGLPVEHQLFKELGKTKHDVDQVKFRKMAYKYAMKYVKIQTKEFKRLGILGQWDDPYLTLSRSYESNILYALAELSEKGYIYKGLKPVNWCKDCETALAEAEVEYEDKVSPSIFVKFPAEIKLGDKKAFLVIWTTTPWTLIGNVAVAVHPDFTYDFIEVGEEIWVLMDDVAASFMEKAGIEDYRILDRVQGKDMTGSVSRIRHPFIDRDSVLVTADYVTREEGTGCVHTAPGHGQDDYVTGLKNDLPVIMEVNGKGEFSSKAGKFSGKDVFSANKEIIDELVDSGLLIKQEDLKHSYPHCWRCKKPVIFRATEQWFMGIDHNDLRNKMLDVINKEVKWVPGSGVDRIGAMVKNRPDWCLSRQRYWGVPIPAVKCRSCDSGFTNSDIIRKVADLTAEGGADIWFEKSLQELFGGSLKCDKCSSGDLVKEEDILDVWFDSGVSFKAVLEARENLEDVADLYLEGSDQHRGWFQAAMITSMGINERPPYKTVLTHGFVVDGDGKKMSKSIGNVIKPEEVMKKFGADILRLWVASSDYTGDIKLSDEILDRLADGYRKIRNTFRYLISNLYDFDPSKDRVGYEDLLEIDKWALSRLAHLTSNVGSSYDKYEFYKVYRAVYDFCVMDISSFYLDVLKDVMYIVTPSSRERRSAQTVMYNMLDILARILSPVLAFTTDEVWDHLNMSQKPESVHMAYWPGDDDEMEKWKDADLEGKWAKILILRDFVLKMLEDKRAVGIIGSSLDAGIDVFSDDAGMSDFLNEYKDRLNLIFKVSQVDVVKEPSPGMEKMQDHPFEVNIYEAKGNKCPRCWNYSVSISDEDAGSGLCERCIKVMDERSSKDGN